MVIIRDRRIAWRLWVGWQCKAADLWVGAFWDRKRVRYYLAGTGTVVSEFHVWICLLPCLPIHIVIPEVMNEFVPHGES
jgi:hypothetical protein